MMSFVKYRKDNEIKVKNRRDILNRYFYVYRITNLIQSKFNTQDILDKL